MDITTAYQLNEDDDMDDISPSNQTDNVPSIQDLEPYKLFVKELLEYAVSSVSHRKDLVAKGKVSCDWLFDHSSMLCFAF